MNVLSKCSGRLKPMIISNWHDGLLYAVLRVFEVENHSYCLRHLRENFVKGATKHGVRSNSCKEVVKEMFNGVPYALT